MTRVLDFDAFRSEKKEEPLVLKLGGKTYDLPPSMPASLAVDIVRMHAEGLDDSELIKQDPAALHRLGAEMFGGSEVFSRVLTDGAVTLTELPDLLLQVLQMYAGPVPNRAARRQTGRRASTSSKTGRSSKPTS